MRTLICGSRDWPDAKMIHKIMSMLPKHTQIIVGGCPTGADAIAETYARQHNMSVLVYRADWDKYGSAAGPIRNQQMLDEGKPDNVLAFQLHNSRGTQSMITIARRANVPVTIYSIEGDR